MTRFTGGAWGVGVAVGVIAAALGVAIVVWPAATVVVVAVLFGVQLLINGVFRIVQAIVSAEASSGTRVLFTLLGVLSFIVGVLVLRHPLQTIVALGLLFGLFWLISGVMELVTAMTDRGMAGRGWIAALGALSVIAGLIMLAWPGLTLTVLTWFFGIWLITWGLLTLGLTLWVHHADTHGRLMGASR
ncbi:hypothetical protein GCM10023085_50310 [Actinomadura viridis]|uniref:Uncharacterized membrane protein HdeD (DUF308 family) n=1 Tax=Actinomadura viridis TaxID=58110 RepID=A0A931GM95_9ACTN|nr:DUF308 domain-containing protein [Actinomadura viridis]MBG6092387.1 uncharacterized membrane protein HdeD (DUF308 family) [Actinomadura viridis]